MITSNLTNYSRIFDNACRTAGKVDQSGTLAAWHQRAKVTRAAMEELRKQYDDDCKSIREEYQPGSAAKRIAPLTESYEDIKAIAQRRLGDDLAAVMAAKRAALSNSQNAPSTDMVNLLTVLNMRTKLTDVEVAEAAGKLSGNIPALLALRDIAKKNGAAFPDISVESMENDLQKAEDFARKYIDTVDKPLEELNYRERLFWVTDGGEAAYFFGNVDNGFTAALEKPKEASSATIQAEAQKQTHIRTSTPVDVRTGSTRDANASKIYLRGDERIAQIAAQFNVTLKDIQAANPGKDIYHLQQGDSLIVRKTQFVETGMPGSIVLDQCVPVSAE